MKEKKIIDRRKKSHSERTSLNFRKKIKTNSRLYRIIKIRKYEQKIDNCNEDIRETNGNRNNKTTLEMIKKKAEKYGLKY